jgi:hypothetical protein
MTIGAMGGVDNRAVLIAGSNFSSLQSASRNGFFSAVERITFCNSFCSDKACAGTKRIKQLKSCESLSPNSCRLLTGYGLFPAMFKPLLDKPANNRLKNSCSQPSAFAVVSNIRISGERGIVTELHISIKKLARFGVRRCDQIVKSNQDHS